LNGNLTLGENIADNGGLKEAYQAFKTHEQEFGVDQLLPAVDLTLDQLFFVGFSQVWCGNVREEEAIRRIYTDPHSPGKYRIIGTLSNSDEFAAAFECPAGSPMNPEDKCQVW
jgi:predicted metalloendopeptidase